MDYGYDLIIECPQCKEKKLHLSSPCLPSIVYSGTKISEYKYYFNIHCESCEYHSSSEEEYKKLFDQDKKVRMEAVMKELNTLSFQEINDKCYCCGLQSNKKIICSNCLEKIYLSLYKHAIEKNHDALKRELTDRKRILEKIKETNRV